MNDLTSQPDSSSSGNPDEGIRRSHDLASGVTTAMQKAQSAIDSSDTLSRQNVLLKTLLTREIMRRGAPVETVYTAFELDHAAQKSKGLMIEPDGSGNYLATFQS